MLGDDAARRSLRSEPGRGSGRASPSPAKFEVDRSLLLKGAKTSANESDLGRNEPGYRLICHEKRVSKASGVKRQPTHVALHEVLLDKVATRREEVDVRAVEAEPNDGLFVPARTVDPRQDRNVEVALDLLGQIDKVLREGEVGHLGRVGQAVLAAEEERCQARFE